MAAGFVPRAGCLPAVMGMAPAGAVFYGVYDLLKHSYIEKQVREGHPNASELPGAYTMLYGSLAGAASEMIVYPLEVVRRNMQVQSMIAATASRAAGSRVASSMLASPSTGAWGRVLASCAAIVQADGARGFYAGVVPNMLQVLPSAALSYWTYETVKSALAAKPA